MALPLVLMSKEATLALRSSALVSSGEYAAAKSLEPSFRAISLAQNVHLEEMLAMKSGQDDFICAFRTHLKATCLFRNRSLQTRCSKPRGLASSEVSVAVLMASGGISGVVARAAASVFGHSRSLRHMERTWFLNLSRLELLYQISSLSS